MTEQFDFSSLMFSMTHIIKRYCTPGYYLENQLHDFHHVLFVESGEGVLMCEDGEIPIPKNTFIYNPPNVAWGYYPSKSNPMCFFGVNFDFISVTNSENNWQMNKVDALPFGRINIIENPESMLLNFNHLFMQWEESKRSNNPNCRASFINILNDAYSQLFDKSHNSISVPIRTAIKFIEKNFEKNISLIELADIAELSSTYFGKVFKSQTGLAPMDYVNSVKVKKAESYLSSGLAISKVSELLGYCDQFYFSKVFKRFCGVSPKAFQKHAFDNLQL